MDPQTYMMMLMMQQQGGMQQQFPPMRAFTQPPMFAGVPIRPSQMFDLSGIPGFSGSSAIGQLVGMGLQTILPALMGPNFIPGQFAPTQGLADHRYAIQHFMQKREAISRASEADQETYFKMIQGFARMRGIEYDKESPRGQAAMRFAGDIASIGPIIGDMMPDFFERAHGTSGSAQMMARNVFEGGRYRLDPVTGRMGMTGESAGNMSRAVFNTLYGPGADMSKMKGLGAGRVGQLFDELTRRGFMPGQALDQEETTSMLSRELARPNKEIASPELRQLKSKFGIKDDDVKAISKLQTELEKLDPQALDAASRSFDASRTSRALEKMASTVAAMRDIFGDMGRTNAPMLELLNGLQALTQGGLSYMRPDQLEKSVRQTYAVAKSTGLGLEGIMGFAGTAGQALDRLGTSRAFAPQIAQSSAAYSFAFGITGQPTAFGALDKEQASQLDIQLRAQATVSPQAARLGALRQFADEFVRRDEKGKLVTGFDTSTEAFAVSEAIRRGETSYDFGGQTKSVFQAAGQIGKILTDAGVNRNEVNQALFRDPRAMAKYIQRDKIEDLVRTAQGSLDFGTAFGNVFAQAAATSLAPLKLDRRTQGQLSRDIGISLIEESRKLFTEDRTLFDDGRETQRNLALADRLRARLGKQLDPVSQEQLANLITNAYGSAEAFTLTSGFAGGKSFVGNLQLFDPKVDQVRKRVLAETQAVTNLQSAFAGIGQQGLVSRISDFIKNAPPGGGKLSDFVLSALGGIPTKQAAGAATGLLQRVADLQSDYEKANNQIRDPKLLQIEQERIMDELRQLGPDVSRAIEGRLDELTPTAQRIIKDYQKKLPPEKVAPVTPEQQQLRDAQSDLRKIQDTQLEKMLPVKEAKERRDNAAEDVNILQDKIAKAKDTPEIRTAKDKLTTASDRRMQIDQELRVEQEKVITSTGKEAETARMRVKQLTSERAEIGKQETEAQREYGVLIQDLESGIAKDTPEIRAARNELTTARDRRTQIDKELRVAQEKVITSTGEESTTAQMRVKQLTSERVAADRQEAASQQLIKDFESKPSELKQLRSAQVKAREELNKRQTELKTEIDKASPTVNALPEVRAARERLDLLKTPSGRVIDQVRVEDVRKQLDEARSDYVRTRDEALDRIAPVKAAKDERDNLTTELRNIQTRLDKEVNTPVIVESKAKLAGMADERITLDKKLKEAERRVDKPTAEYITDQIAKLDNAERKLRGVITDELKTVVNTPEVIRLREQQADVTVKLDKAKQALDVEVVKAQPEIDKDENVIRSRKRIEDTEKELQKALAGAPITRETLTAEADKAKQDYLRLRDVALEKQEPIKQLRGERAEAAERLKTIQSDITAARESPATIDLLKQLSTVKEDKKQVDAQIVDAQAKGDDTLLRRLQIKREQLDKQEAAISDDYVRETRTVDASDKVKILREKETRAKADIEQIDQKLTTAIDKATPEVEKDPVIKAAKERKDRAERTLEISGSPDKARKQLEEARTEYTKAQETALDKIKPVTEAKAERVKLTAELKDVQAKIDKERETPVIVESKTRLGEIATKKQKLDEELRIADKSGDREAYRDVARQIVELGKEESKLQDVIVKEMKAADAKPELVELRKQEGKIRADLVKADQTVTLETGKAQTEIAKDENVRKSRERVLDAERAIIKEPPAVVESRTKLTEIGEKRKQLDEQLERARNIGDKSTTARVTEELSTLKKEETRLQEVIKRETKSTDTSKREDSKVTTERVTLVSTTTNIRDSKIEIPAARDVRLTTDKVVLASREGETKTKEMMESEKADKPRRLSGTVTLEGLDTLIFTNVTETPSNDTRGA